MTTKIVITRLKIDKYEVPGPKETKQLHKYDREVIREDGRFVTILTRKKKS